MTVKVRIYRVHDYDLWALHASGALKTARAMKDALVAYYRKEWLDIEVDADMAMLVPESSRASMQFSLEITEEDAPGFEEWFRGIRAGVRNCCCKTILRHYLPGFGVGFFRNDAKSEDPEKGKSAKYEASTEKTGKTAEKTGQKRKKPAIMGRNDDPPGTTGTKPSGEPDGAFDAFEEMLSLQKG